MDIDNFDWAVLSDSNAFEALSLTEGLVEVRIRQKDIDRHLVP